MLFERNAEGDWLGRLDVVHISAAVRYRQGSGPACSQGGFRGVTGTEKVGPKEEIGRRWIF